MPTEELKKFQKIFSRYSYELKELSVLKHEHTETEKSCDEEMCDNNMDKI